MEKGMSVNFKIRVFPVIIGAFGVLLTLALWIVRLNLIAVISALYCCIVSALLFLGTVTRKRINIWYFYGYVAASFGITMYYIVWGADASFGMRLLSNIGLALPSFIVILFLYYVSLYVKKHRQVAAAVCLSVALILTSVVYALTMNLKSKPKAFSLQKGHDEYLAGVDADKTKANSPNVLFILMDDLGYGDISRYGAIFDTPNIDSIADNGLYFENFYATYSVCSPSRFAAMTGRYPYRGYADNVMYPTEKCFVPFSMTRHYNSFELGNNVDGMLGDEITVAETFKAAGYNTGAIGKWHLGDYGQYLPTNQGFDYFYGSYQVNDMTPYYFVTEQNGEATPDPDFTTAKLRESQAGVTKKLHEEMTAFITDAAEGDAPFFAYYSTPWPHAPLSVGEEFDGATGLGVYADCVTEFDYYLGELFETMKELGVYDNTVIVFTSDNGPALQGSTGELRGGKYLAYEGGQKVPFMMKWEANPEAVGAVTGSATRVEGSAVLVDLYPTLVELAGILARLGMDVGGHSLLLLRSVALVVGVERGGEGLVEPLLVGEQLCTGGEQPPPHPLPLDAERRGVDGAEQLQGAVGRRFEYCVRGPELRLGGPLSAAAGEAEQHQGQQQVCERSFHGRMYGTLLIGGAVRDARGATS